MQQLCEGLHRLLSLTGWPADRCPQGACCCDLVAESKEWWPATARARGFEPMFFNHFVMALDNYFVHRARNLEGKDGNPLNEVRLLANSPMSSGGVLTDKKGSGWTRRGQSCSCSSETPSI